MKNNPSNKQTAQASSAKVSANDTFFSEEFDPVREARIQATEAITRILIWVAEATSVQNRGVRSTIALYCVRPDLINGITLDKIGDQSGITKQAAQKLANDFRLCMGLIQ